MYYIYHIKGVKVGCTTDLKKRVELVQGFKDYEVLYKTRDVLNASIAELYYQNIFKYKLDKNSYLKLTQKKMLHITERTITFRNTNDSKFIGYKFPQIIELLDGTHIELNDQTIEWILNNNSESHRNKERFVYIQALLNHVNSIKTNELDIFKDIREWASNKGIFEKGDVKTQYIKLQEEAGELAKALLTNDKEEIIDAIGDCVVVLTNLSKLAGYNIEDCILSAYNVISKRTGKMENGTFKKD